MSIDNKHPEYANSMKDWKVLRDLYAGSRVIKEATTEYLPPTAGMLLDGMAIGQPGLAAYQSYITRALVPDYIREGVEVLVGLLHQKDAIIELPKVMEPIRQWSTANGEPLTALHRRISAEQLILGRVGLLIDMPEIVLDNNTLPYLCLFTSDTIINWNVNEQIQGMNQYDFIAIDESGDVFDPQNFSWQFKNSYRVLKLEESIYKMGVYEQTTSYDSTQMIAPIYKGASLPSIPFTFINTKDLLAKPDEPPLMGLANLTLAIYRAEADYRQSLYMQGQDTLVVIGGVRNPTGIPGEPEAIRTGAGSRLDVDVNGDAKYIGVSSDGLSEQRTSLENDKKVAQIKAGELIQSQGSQNESGTALNTRFTAQTATLNHIALTGALGLQNALRQIAKWIGANPDEVKVTPNLEFINFDLDGQNMYQIMQARDLGLPLSLASIHAILADRGLTNFDFNTETDKIIEERKMIKDMIPEQPEPKAPGTKTKADGSKKPDAKQIP